MKSLVFAAVLTCLPHLSAANPITFDGVTFEGQPLGMMTATVGITPFSSSTFGRFFYGGNRNGFYDASVFWVGADDPTGDPFTVVNGALEFLPGTYTHSYDGRVNGTLTIAPSLTADAYVFLFDRGAAAMTLPSTVTPWINPGPDGDRYYLPEVPVLISRVPAPEPGIAGLFTLGLLSVLAARHFAQRTGVAYAHLAPRL